MWSAARMTSGIVLDDQDGIADLAQFVQDADQAAGVARVQADGRLVEHVAGAHQARSQTGGELDALRFAAGERGGEAVERQVFQAYIVQKFETLADLDQDLFGDGGFLRRELQGVEECLRPRAMFMRTTSAMLRSPTRMYSASLRRRAPLQSGQRA